jgi:neutral ceramidase
MSTPTSQLHVGLGRAEITACAPGLSMFGWGSTANIPVGAATPLWARAIALTEGPTGPLHIWVTAELGMISEALRLGALEELQDRGVAIDAHRFAITATHTHSGPSGYSTYLFYAMTGPGFSPALLRRLVIGVADAAEAAVSKLRRARVFLRTGEVPREEALSFNRALDAFHRNPEARAEDAADRRMTVLRFEEERGRPMGLLAFFALHGTTIHADNDLLHADSFGVAATTCERREQQLGNSDFLAVFAQTSPGDVTPNHRLDTKRGVTAGRFEDDVESVHWIGETLARHARLLSSEARHHGTELRGPLSAVIQYSDFDCVAVDDDLSGEVGARTSSARLGLTSACGTQEGPGPLLKVPRLRGALERLLKLAQRDEQQPSQGSKTTLLSLAHDAKAPPSIVRITPDRRLRYLHTTLATLAKRGESSRPWVPHRLPFQIFRLGALAVALTPFEPTTIAGRRIRALVADEFNLGSEHIGEIEGQPVTTVVAAGYANAYVSYLTTPEEYDLQHYEGAFTLFGRWALPAVCTELRRVVRAMANGADLRSVPSAVVCPPLRWLPSVDGESHARLPRRSVVRPQTRSR